MQEFYDNENVKKKISTEYNINNIPKIRVVVRKRPINKKEISKNDMDIIDTKMAHTIIVKELK